MTIAKDRALPVIDIRQSDFTEMREENWNDRRWDCIKNGRRILVAFHRLRLPVIQVKEVHREDYVDFGRELDGTKGPHCIETDPLTDFARLTYPTKGDYIICKRRYSAFFGTDLEILLKGLHVHTLYMIGGLTDVCIHYTAVDAHQNDYFIKVVKDAVAGSGKDAHEAALKAIGYLQRDALIMTQDVVSAQRQDD